MASKRTTRTSPSQAPVVNTRRRLERQEEPQDQEVNQREERGESQVGPQQAPPPPVIDLVHMIHNQTLLLDALANSINRPRPHGQGMIDKLTEFLRTKPPTFGRSNNPLDADDWLRVIQRKLEPFGCEDRDKVLLTSHQLT